MSHSSKNLILGLDIGTSSIKAVISSFSKEGEITPLSFGIQKQFPGAMASGEILDLSLVIEASKKAIRKAEEKAGRSVRSVVVGLTGEQLKETVSLVRYHRTDEERPFSEEEMNAIAEKIQSKTKKKFEREIAFGGDDSEIELISSALISFSIDGKKTDEPIGLEGEEVVIEFYTAFAPQVQVDAVRELCDELKLDLVSIATDPFAVSRAILGDEGDGENFIALHIDQKNTDISVIEKGAIRGSKIIGVGKKAIEKDLSVWISALKIALSEFPHFDLLPPDIFLCGEGADSPELQEYLALGNWYEDLNFDRRPVIKTINTQSAFDDDESFNPTFIVANGLVQIALDLIMSEENSFVPKDVADLL